MAGKGLRKGPSSTTPTPSGLSQLTNQRVLSKKLVSLGQELCHSHSWQRYQDSKDDRHIFVSTGRNCKVDADIGLNYTCKRRFVAIIKTEAGTNFIPKNKLPDRFETKMSTRPLQYLFDTSHNLLQTIRIVKMPVLLSWTQAALRFIICKTLKASTIIGADFCNQHVTVVQPKQKFVELDTSGCIQIVQKPPAQTRAQPLLPDGLIYPKNSSKPFFGPHSRKIPTARALSHVDNHSDSLA